MDRTPQNVAPPGIPTVFRRETRGGRTLEYELVVIQQPERARACGSGAKSSADRRPVDPPPVVELRIHDINGLGPEGKEDVTFSYDANFFLFATLEVDVDPKRPIAPHRGQGQQAQQIPVLTGMPVSGMAYLDRPKPAGYFIFPDLSVRHEGFYHLSFNLYEETKKSSDTNKEVSTDGGIMGGSTEASFDWRMETKSAAFTVYSAKKFPGLAESTALSRTVADQGCRVRIRRDVRMRKRESKGSGDYDEVPEEEMRGRQESHHAGERSRSNSSDTGDGYYQDQSQQTRGNSPIAPSTARPAGGYLGDMFGNDRFAPPPQPPPAPMQSAPQSYHQQQQSYQRNDGSMHHVPFSQPPPPPPNNHYQQHPQSAHPNYAPRESFESDRRQSYPVYASQAPQHTQYNAPPNSQYAQYQPQPSYNPHRNETPAQTHLPPMKYDHSHSQFDRAPLPKINAAPSGLFLGHERGLEPQPPMYSAPPPLQEFQKHTGKRQYDSAFVPKTESLSNGMRPSSPHDRSEEEQEALDLKLMHYRRADGSNITRDPPSKLRTYS